MAKSWLRLTPAPHVAKEIALMGDDHLGVRVEHRADEGAPAPGIADQKEHVLDVSKIRPVPHPVDQRPPHERRQLQTGSRFGQRVVARIPTGSIFCIQRGNVRSVCHCPKSTAASLDSYCLAYRRSTRRCDFAACLQDEGVGFAIH